MEIEKVDESKIKVVLEAEELAFLGMSFDALDYNDTKTKRFLTDLLNDACVMTGTDYVKGKVLIEAYPTPFGGCVIYFIKLDQKESSKKLKGIRAKTARIYQFSNAESMLSAMEQLNRLAPVICLSTLYLLEEKYYLFLMSEVLSVFALSPLLYEFGAKTAGIQNESYYKEHAKVLCKENAIEKIGGCLIRHQK